MTCDFESIKDPLDQVLRTRFICTVNNEAILKTLFGVKDGELAFVRTIQIVQETKEAAGVAKETVYVKTSKPVHKAEQPKAKANPPRASTYKAKDAPQGNRDQPFSKGSCGRCVRKITTLVKISHTLMMSAITARRRDAYNQFVCRKGRRTLELRTCTCDSGIR